MLELLTRERSDRLLQERVLRVPEEHPDRGPRSLLLAVGMVEQHILDVRRSAMRPLDGCAGGQVEHGRGV